MCTPLNRIKLTSIKGKFTFNILNANENELESTAIVIDINKIFGSIQYASKDKIKIIWKVVFNILQDILKQDISDITIIYNDFSLRSIALLVDFAKLYNFKNIVIEDYIKNERKEFTDFEFNELSKILIEKEGLFIDQDI